MTTFTRLFATLLCLLFVPVRATAGDGVIKGIDVSIQDLTPDEIGKIPYEIYKSFRSELKDSIKIIIAQRISSVKDTDKIIVLDNGKISDIGTHNELLSSNEIYKEICRSQKNTKLG